MTTPADEIVGICRYCRAPVRRVDVDVGRVVVVLETPEGGKLYAHAEPRCLPKDGT